MRLQYLPILGFLFSTARHIVVKTNSQTHLMEDSVDAWDGISLDNLNFENQAMTCLKLVIIITGILCLQ